MELYTYTEPYDYLEHHGIKGQRWGIRRYQNMDGSLKPAGEKHRKSLGERIHDHKVKKQRKAALEKARATRAAKKEAEEKAKKEAEDRRKKFEAGKIRAKDMTNEELREMTARKKAEYDLKQQELANSRGRRFAAKMLDEAIIPAATGAAKNLAQKTLEKYGEQYLGLNAKSAYEKLKQQHEMSKWKKEIQENKDWFEDKEHIREAERAKRDADIAKNRRNERVDKDYFDNRDAELAERKAKRDADKAKRDKDMKEYEDYQRKEKDSRENPTVKENSTYRKKGSEIPKDDLSDGKKYAVAIRNEPSSTSVVSSGKTYANNYTSSNRSTSTVPESHRISGKEYFENNGHRWSVGDDGIITQED